MRACGSLPEDGVAAAAVGPDGSVGAIEFDGGSEVVDGMAVIFEAGVIGERAVVDLRGVKPVVELYSSIVVINGGVEFAFCEVCIRAKIEESLFGG